ncbi:metal-dependent transcriptional regulator [Schaalia vaccimaxillae]|uniref:metal-dependent transcriptional regulator n=1 Tax=Schaalia vaccimaxillae TaxID=183916 RepID=UPI0003B37CB1|nr:metal-dependent transcriptional regulator [Schaalia vaccimaxillae]
MDALSQGWQTPVTQDYLKIIWAAQEAGAVGVSINELAAKAGVVASTASENVRRLKDQGLVFHEPYQKVHLTDRGHEVAVGMIRRHRILETYLHEELDFDWDEVHEEAEILEHAVSDRLLKHLDRALGYPTRDPHGDPIPREDGSVTSLQVVPLGSLAVGRRALVARISDAHPQVLRDLEEAGLLLDTKVQIQDRSSSGDTFVLVTRNGNEGESVCLSPEQLAAIQVLVDEDSAPQPQ